MLIKALTTAAAFTLISFGVALPAFAETVQLNRQQEIRDSISQYMAVHILAKDIVWELKNNRFEQSLWFTASDQKALFKTYDFTIDVVFNGSKTEFTITNKIGEIEAVITLDGDNAIQSTGIASVDLQFERLLRYMDAIQRFKISDEPKPIWELHI